MHTINSVVKVFADFSDELDHFCIELVGRATNDSVRLILQNVARWKKQVAAVIEGLRSVGTDFDADLGLADTTFRSERIFSGVILPTDIDKNGLIESLVEIFDLLLGYCDWLLAQPTAAAGRKFLKTLRENLITELAKLRSLSSMPTL